MYRSIIIVFLSFISCGLTNTVNETSKELQCRKTSPILNASRTYANSCFRSIVRVYLDLEDNNRVCSNVKDMEKGLRTHIEKVRKECVPTLMANDTIIRELVNFSLSNDSFKKFYSDAKCVEKLKPNITSCINGTVGSSNRTLSKHSSWIDKSTLNYNNWSFDMSNELKICVNKVLSACKQTTRDFVNSLFNITISHRHDLISNNKIVKDPPEPKPIAAILGISAAIIIVGAILVVIIVKMKKCD